MDLLRGVLDDSLSAVLLLRTWIRDSRLTDLVSGLGRRSTDLVFGLGRQLLLPLCLCSMGKTTESNYNAV